MPTKTTVERDNGPVGAANTAVTVSSKAVQSYERRVLSAVYIAYSANASVSVTVTINSGLGADFDVRVAAIVLSVNQWGVYIPERPLSIAVGDVIDVLLPAGGAGVTATAQILFEVAEEVSDEQRGYETEQRMGAR